MNTELDKLLAELMLYRNDPSYAGRLEVYAQAGEVDAQYALGLVLAEGRSAAPDPVAAYFWLQRAEAQGDSEARMLRFAVMQHMSANQIERAELALATGESPGPSLQ